MPSINWIDSEQDSIKINHREEIEALSRQNSRLKRIIKARNERLTPFESEIIRMLRIITLSTVATALALLLLIAIVHL